MLRVRGQTLIVVAAHGARVAACPVLTDPEMVHRSDLPLDWTQTLRLGLKGNGVIRCVPRMLALDGRWGSSAYREIARPCFSGRPVARMRRVGRVADDLAEHMASMVSREMRLQARENA